MNIPSPLNTPYTVFISDIHLTPQRVDLSAGLAKLMQSDLVQNSDALYILGDLPDYWIGDDTPLTGMEVAFEALKLNNHIPKYFQHGNRDFLIGETFSNTYNIQLLPESVVVDLYGTPTLLLHGDTLCTDDIDYQNFRKMVRNPNWIQTITSKPLQERIQLAKEIRTKTTAETAKKDLEIMDVNEAEVTRTFQDHAVRRIIHGHTHRPSIHITTEGTRIVLSDWDKQGHCLLVTKDEITEVDFDI